MAVARRDNWGGGGKCIFIYHVHIPQKQSFSKEIRRAEQEYINIHPPWPWKICVHIDHLKADEQVFF